MHAASKIGYTLLSLYLYISGLFADNSWIIQLYSTTQLFQNTKLLLIMSSADIIWHVSKGERRYIYLTAVSRSIHFTCASRHAL